MVAYAFNNGRGSRIAHSKALAGYAVEEYLAAGCAVEDNVAHEDAFLGQKARSLGWISNDAPAREPLAYVIVGVTFKLERHAGGRECAKALSGRAGEFEMNCAIGQAC